MNAADAIAALERYQGELESILSRFNRKRDSITIQPKDDARYREIVLELASLFDDEFASPKIHTAPLLSYFQDSISNFYGSPSYHGVECVKGVVTAALARVRRTPLALKQAQLAAALEGRRDTEAVTQLWDRFHLFARQLRQRHNDRPTLNIDDEYDVQDALHALLRLQYDDVREEEWTPSYAGGAARMDFLLPAAEAVVEVKMTRPSLTAKKLGEELIVDIAKYRQHPQCRALLCLVYDPQGYIANPRGIENDLNSDEEEMAVRVVITPR